jgi:hypothetical protein
MVYKRVFFSHLSHFRYFVAFALQPQQSAMLGIFHLSLLAAVAASAVRKTVDPPFSFASNASQLVSINNASTLRVPIPFGTTAGIQFSEPSLVHTAEIEFNINHIASDEEWNKYTAKGRWYACLLDMTIEKAGKVLGDPGIPPSSESIFQGDFREDIQNWGWHETPYSPDVGANFIKNNRIKPALDQLGLSALPLGKGGDNECWSIEHGDEDRVDEDGDEVPFEDQIYQINNDKYPCTGAYYRFAMNKKGGAIFAQSLLSPRAAAEKNHVDVHGGDKLPHLQRASDILWSYWYRDNPDPKKLWAFFVNYVRNEETLPLIARIMLKYNMAKVPYYPGLILELERPDLEVEAILGR